MTHKCDHCGSDVDRTVFCDSKCKMRFHRKGEPRPNFSRPESEKPVQSDFLTAMREKTDEILKKPVPKPTPVFYTGRPQGPQAPLPDQFFEEEKVIID